MLSTADIKNYLSNYKVQDGIVIDKSTNQKVENEDIVLRVKASVLIYNEAKSSYENRIQSRVNTATLEWYVENTIQKFGVNGEINDHSRNKTIRNILNNQSGFIDDKYPAGDLNSEKYNILMEPRKDYTLALINLIAHEQGKHVDNLGVQINNSEFGKLGHSIVSVSYTTSKYEKKNMNQGEQEREVKDHQEPLFQHPRAEELNELERQKRIAKQNNDDVAYQYAQSNIERIIRDNQASITSEEWNLMSSEQQMAFVQLKINESKILHDKVSFDYWSANLASLKSKRESSDMIGQQESSNNSLPNTPITQIEQVQKNKEKDERLENYKYCYEKLMKAVKRRQAMTNATDAEKKQVVGEIFYYEGYLINSLEADNEFREIMSSVVDDLSGNEFDMNLQNIIISDMQERLSKVQGTNLESPTMENTNDVENKNKTQFGILINQLQEQVNRVSNEYQKMFSSGYVDDDLLSTLINKMNELDDNAATMKTMIEDPEEQLLLKPIMEKIEHEKNKMIQLQKGIDDSIQTFKGY